MHVRDLVLASLLAAISTSGLAQSSGGNSAAAGASATTGTNPDSAQSPSRRQSIRVLPLDIKLGDTGIALPPSEPEPAEEARKDAKGAQEAAPKPAPPDAREKRN